MSNKKVGGRCTKREEKANLEQSTEENDGEAYVHDNLIKKLAVKNYNLLLLKFSIL